MVLYPSLLLWLHCVNIYEIVTLSDSASYLESAWGSHIHVACRSVRDCGQNGIKQSSGQCSFWELIKGSRRIQYQLINALSQILGDVAVFVLWTPVKSSDQEPRNWAFKDDDHSCKCFYRRRICCGRGQTFLQGLTCRSGEKDGHASNYMYCRVTEWWTDWQTTT